MKKKYLRPRVESIVVFSEESIAAGSASFRPQNGADEVTEQWYQDDKDTRNIDW